MMTDTEPTRERRAARASQEPLLLRRRFSLLVVSPGRRVPLVCLDFSELGFRVSLPAEFRGQRFSTDTSLRVLLRSAQTEVEFVAKVVWQEGLEVGLEVDWSGSPLFVQGFLARLAKEANARNAVEQGLMRATLAFQ